MNGLTGCNTSLPSKWESPLYGGSKVRDLSPLRRWKTLSNLVKQPALHSDCERPDIESIGDHRQTSCYNSSNPESKSRNDHDVVSTEERFIGNERTSISTMTICSVYVGGIDSMALRFPSRATRTVISPRYAGLETEFECEDI